MRCDTAVSLYVVYHDTVPITPVGCLIPICSTRADGQNIASKSGYCELRAQYWVWKNAAVSAEMVGFFHFRRYLAAHGLIHLPVKKRPLPYRIVPWPFPGDYEQETIAALSSELDVIAPIWEYTGIPVYQRYANGSGQRGSDLECIRSIILEIYPQFAQAMDTYLTGCGEYYGNMFIMRRSIFLDYCGWLFEILNRFDAAVTDAPSHTQGYLGERLFGIYFTWLQQSGHVRCGELPRLLFSGYDDDTHHFGRKRLVNFLLPPGSRRRAAAARCVSTWGR